MAPKGLNNISEGEELKEDKAAAISMIQKLRGTTDATLSSPTMSNSGDSKPQVIIPKRRTSSTNDLKATILSPILSPINPSPALSRRRHSVITTSEVMDKSITLPSRRRMSLSEAGDYTPQPNTDPKSTWSPTAEPKKGILKASNKALSAKPSKTVLMRNSLFGKTYSKKDDTVKVSTDSPVNDVLILVSSIEKGFNI